MKSPKDLNGSEVLSLLTPDDWSAVSAAVGYTVGPDANGALPKLAPITAFVIASMRQEGVMPAGSELTAQTWIYKFGDGSTSDPSDPGNSQYLHLIAYLKQHDAASLAPKTSAAGLDLSL
jgi:hypothetical protein